MFVLILENKIWEWRKSIDGAVPSDNDRRAANWSFNHIYMHIHVTITLRFYTASPLPEWRPDRKTGHRKGKLEPSYTSPYPSPVEVRLIPRSAVVGSSCGGKQTLWCGRWGLWQRVRTLSQAKVRVPVLVHFPVGGHHLIWVRMTRSFAQRVIRIWKEGSALSLSFPIVALTQKITSLKATTQSSEPTHYFQSTQFKAHYTRHPDASRTVYKDHTFQHLYLCACI